MLLSEFNGGKLVWKVDWPMRWTYEGVIFEPSGVDHQSPGSSWVVGGQLVAEVFGGTQPIGPMYAFVGIKGMAKMSSSRGGVPTPADALEIMEPPLVRWLYSRRKPAQSFNVAFDGEVHRMYDEWDSLSRKVADGTAQPADLAAHTRATTTAGGDLPRHAAAAALPHAGLGPRHHHRRTTSRRCGSCPTSTPSGPVALAGRAAAPADLRAALGRHPDAGPGPHRTCATEPDTELLDVAGRAGRASRCGCWPRA